MIHYLLQVTCCWTVFYLLFHFLLKKETFFNINRWYLLSTLLLGLVLPLLKYISQWLTPDEGIIIAYTAPLATGVAQIEATVNSVAQQSSVTFINILLGIYIAGVIFFLTRFLKGIHQIYQLYSRSKKVRMNKIILVKTPKTHLPFSFFNYLFWSDVSELTKEEKEKIWTHEAAHINQWHTIDVLLLEFCGILMWCSPLIYFYKKSLRDVHEFLADAFVLQTTEKKKYGYLLLQQAQPGLQMALANHFIQSQLKKRIIMMTKTKSRSRNRMKYLIGIPLLFALFTAFAFQSGVFKTLNYNAACNPHQLDANQFNEQAVKEILLCEFTRDRTVKNVKEGTQVKGEFLKSIAISDFMGTYRAVLKIYPTHEAEINEIAYSIADEYGFNASIDKNTIIYRDEIDDFDKAKIKRELSLLAQDYKSVSLIKDKEIKYQLFEGYLQSVIFKYPNHHDDITKVCLELLQESFPFGFHMTNNAIVTSSYIQEDTRENIVKTFDGDFAPDLIHKKVDEMPRFAGCEEIVDLEERNNCSTQKLLEFIYKNIKYPAIARDTDIEGTVVLRFVVDKTGKITSPEILRDIGGGCGEEALRVVKMMPDWIAGKHEGKTANVYFNLPIKFKLQGEAPTEEVQDDEIFKLVEEMPRFYNEECEKMEVDNKTKTDCSQKEMLMFIYKNIKYPSLARHQGLEGTTVIRFVVEKDGSISNPEAVRNPGGGLGEEAIRVVKMMPKWIPGKQAGKIVKVHYNLPVKFKLEGDASPKQLYYEIDGQEATEAHFKNLTPDDILIIDIKGEEAIKQYGEKAKDGAIIIITKKVIPNTTINSPKSLPSASLYPNPVEDQLNVKFELEKAPISVIISDMSGREIYRQDVKDFDGIYNEEINLEKAPKGALLLQVLHEGSIYTEKFIKQ